MANVTISSEDFAKKSAPVQSVNGETGKVDVSKIISNGVALDADGKTYSATAAKSYWEITTNGTDYYTYAWESKNYWKRVPSNGQYIAYTPSSGHLNHCGWWSGRYIDKNIDTDTCQYLTLGGKEYPCWERKNSAGDTTFKAIFHPAGSATFSQNGVLAKGYSSMNISEGTFWCGYVKASVRWSKEDLSDAEFTVTELSTEVGAPALEEGKTYPINTVLCKCAGYDVKFGTSGEGTSMMFCLYQGTDQMSGGPLVSSGVRSFDGTTVANSKMLDGKSASEFATKDDAMDAVYEEEGGTRKKLSAQETVEKFCPVKYDAATGKFYIEVDDEESESSEE